MGFNIYVPKSIYTDENLTDYDVAMYCVIQPFYSLPFSDGAYVSMKMVKYVMYGGKVLNWKQKNEAEESIQRLIDRGVFSGSCISDDVYSLERYELPKYYATIDYEDIKLILDSQNKSRYAVIRYLCALIGSFNNKIKIGGRTNIIGTQKISYYQHLLNINSRTIIRYNALLEELKVIYVAHVSGKDGETQNIYGRYGDQDLVDQYVGKGGYSQSIANNHRAVSQKYNAFVKAGGKGYSDRERLRLYRACKSYNEEMERLQQEQAGSDYLRRCKNLSVFGVDDEE